MSLALLPSEHISEAWEDLKDVTISTLSQEEKLKFAEFKQYIQTYWLEQVGANIISVAFAPRRTNNVVESFNRRLNLRARIAHPSPYTFAQVVGQELTAAESDITAMANGNPVRTDGKNMFSDKDAQLQRWQRLVQLGRLPPTVFLNKAAGYNKQYLLLTQRNITRHEELMGITHPAPLVEPDPVPDDEEPEMDRESESGSEGVEVIEAGESSDEDEQPPPAPPSATRGVPLLPPPSPAVTRAAARRDEQPPPAPPALTARPPLPPPSPAVTRATARRRIAVQGATQPSIPPTATRREGRTSRAGRAATQPAGREEAQQRTTSVTEEIPFERLCVVCLTNRRNAAIIPCGHANVCIACATRTKSTAGTCPACRGPINNILPLYDQ